MKVQIKLISVLFLLFLGFSKTSKAETAIPEGCFDFSSHRAAPLQEIRNLPPGDEGTLSSGATWALEKKIIHHPIGEVLSELQKHDLTRDNQISDIKIHSISDPYYYARQNLELEVRPFPLISIRWSEEWAFFIQKSQNQEPEKAWVGFQKTAGTSHIEHLCGSYLLKKITRGQTEVSFFEEIAATRQSPEKTREAVQTVLKRLEQEK